MAYTNKQVAEKLNKPIADIYKLKAKYKHLFREDHCKLTKVNGCNISLWSDLGVDRLKEVFSIESQRLKKEFSQSDFDEAIAYFEAQIAELKAKYPEFVNTKTSSYSSKFRGVYKTLSGRYSARYGGSKVRTNIGVYSTSEEAARAYDLAVAKFYGEGCITNFAVEGVKTKVLFPNYLEAKSHELDLLSPEYLPTKKGLPQPEKPRIIEQKTLIDLLPQSQETSSQNISPFSELLDFVATNNIEIHTRQSA